jgi:hypothetical protein
MDVVTARSGFSLADTAAQIDHVAQPEDTANALLDR